MNQQLVSTDKDEWVCTFGLSMGVDLEAKPFINASSYLPLIIVFVGAMILGKNIEGTRLTMVFLISGLLIVQSVATLILTSVFLCFPGDTSKDHNQYRTPPYG